MTRALSWFKQIYNFEFEKVLSDNATECKGSLIKEHPLETKCQQLGIKHINTRSYSLRPMARWKLSGKLSRMNSFIPIHLILSRISSII